METWNTRNEGRVTGTATGWVNIIDFILSNSLNSALWLETKRVTLFDTMFVNVMHKAATK